MLDRARHGVGDLLLSAAARCQRCGAPLEITPETIVAVCSYCGYPNWTAQAYTHPIVIVPAEHSRARRYFEDYLRTDPDMRRLRGVRLRSIETIYIPLYTASLTAMTRYWGVASVTLTRVRVVKVGDKTQVKTETRIATVTVEGEREKHYMIPVIARRSVDKSYTEPLASHLLESRPEPKPIQEVDWESVKGTVLAAEIPAGDAEVWARDEACDRLQEEVEKEMADQARSKAAAMNPGWVPSAVAWTSKRIPCRASQATISPLILAPAVVALYTYQGGVYKAVFAGWDGARIYAEEPLTPIERMGYLAASIGSAGILGGGGAALLAGGGDLALGGLIMLLLGAAGAYYAASTAVSDVRVEKKGEG